MKERMLVLAKAYPVVSSKYQELVCVAGITESGEIRRIYPIPWETFWNHKGFKKKAWIEYEALGPKKEDSRKESIKIDPSSITTVGEAGFKEILKLIKPHVSTVEDHVKDFKQANKSLGFVKPHILDFIREERLNKRMENLKPQQTLDGKSAVRIDLIPEQLSYVYKCSPDENRPHSHMCEDWELGALYRQYLPDTDKAFEKCKDKFLVKLPKKKDLHLMLGTHYRWKTPMIISVLYPKKDEE
jgi:hypothetical protein